MYQVPKGMYKCCSHGKAAVSMATAVGCVRRVRLRYVRVRVGMGVGVKVARLIQQKTHSESERRKTLQETGFKFWWVGVFCCFFSFILNQIIEKVIYSVSFLVFVMKMKGSSKITFHEKVTGHE